MEGRSLSPNLVFPLLVYLFVCQRWWRVTESTPLLWTTLTLDRPFLQHLSIHLIQCLATTWFDRAGSLSLSLDLRTGRDDQGDYSFLVLPYCDRMQDLVLQCYNQESIHDLLSAFSSSPPIHFPWLWDFMIHSIDSHGDILGPLHIGSAVNVQTLSMSISFNQWIIISNFLPWANLSNLTMQTIFPTFRPLLATCQNLKSGNFIICRHTGPDLAPTHGQDRDQMRGQYAIRSEG